MEECKDMSKQNSILVLGASPNPVRTSYLAAKVLIQKGYAVSAYGNRVGKIDHLNISNEIPKVSSEQVDAITIFMKPEKQRAYYDYIIAAKPRNLIFNPGSENPELEQLAERNKINIIHCCTIALSAVGLI